MRYPINEELMATIYKENLSANGSEFSENNEEYIKALAELMNNAYKAGVEAGKAMIA